MDNQKDATEGEIKVTDRRKFTSEGERVASETVPTTPPPLNSDEAASQETGPKATECTGRSACIVQTHSVVSLFHTRTVWSSEPETMSLPSGLKATE